MAHHDEEINRIADEDYGQEKNREVFLPYRCHSLGDITNYKSHPGNVVEAASLAAQILPPTNYPLKDALPPHLILDCKLSDLQLEGILHACQRHQMILPKGARAGFYLGDAAGVGKGRQIAGIIINNYVRGRRKHLWFSTSHDLRIDAERDLKDINCFIKVIDGCQELDRETRVAGMSPQVKDGILFNTYATLISSGQRGFNPTHTRGSRIQQILDWCGDNFNGCLIFDECHKAKQFIPGNEAASTKAAVAAIALQRQLPKARVVYCSATGVTNVKNMAFMERLGLWGDNTAFKNVENFIQAMTTRGLGASEMLAMEMKAAGMYVSRGLSFESAEFHTVEINLTDEQIRVYNLSARVWQQLAEAIKKAISHTKSSASRIWTVYWSCHQRFFKQLCMSLKVPAIVREAKAALDEGYCVVIGLQTTGEASLDNEITRQGNNTHGYISTAKEILVRFILQHFPIEEKTSKGTKINAWCKNAADALLQFIDNINLPNCSLDELIQQLGGTNCVAEMTGRRGRIVCINGSSTPVYQLRDTDSSSDHGLESLNVREKNLFMQGKKLIAVLSDAASTGISLHSDTRVANNRRRIHITMELPWSAEKAVQQLGRSHRSNQSSAPIYKLMTTNVGGEKRFVAAVAQRLLSLGALTRGDRRAATGADFSEFNFNTSYGRSALKLMYSYIQRGVLCPNITFSSILQASTLDDSSYTISQFYIDMKHCLLDMGLTASLEARVPEKDATDVQRFLNRILGLTIERQNLIFSYFCQCLTTSIERAKKEGKYNEGVTDIKGTSIVMVDSPKEIFTEVKRGNVSTKQVTLCVDRGIDWPTVLKLYHEQATDPLDGFYCSRNRYFNRKFYLFALYKAHLDVFSVVRPNTGFSSYMENSKDLLQKYHKLDLSDAENGWKEQYNSTELACIHGGSCKFGSYCTVGIRINRVHIICGGIIPMLSLLESMLTNCARKYNLSKEQQTLRIVRVQLDDGRKIVGLRYPEPIISEVTTVLKWAVQQRLLKNQGLLDSATRLPTVLQEGSCYALADAVLLTVVGGAKLITEDDDHVNERLLKRAFTKPLSIRNYFTTQQNNLHGQENKQGEKLNDNQNNSSNNDDIVVISDVTNVSPTHRSMNGSSIPVRNGKQKAGNKRHNKDIHTDSNNTKRHRQLKVFDAFQQNGQNKTANSDEDSADESDDSLLIYCPVCNHCFPSNTSNQIINQHLDQCLAGNADDS
ncbi:uncharacterized protein TRIADDRAFT_54670 [Trichoplax adhaerens]|uniref:Helicase ATP-binding domain-containing protein n=1 Tax=Trichoplax adhaerens TaxID=10228 RepID=B3RSN6_TRIAD|nr:hypothetical protein TRIADDRAFT_54670 [Trichoplax adhaerens]EDV27087.1 hypothetical protein TRIADDRAFT_54670 [Trichoplax adhaerens]|eukprot:XP_002111083.1 hypothetical protein TRIADDRAFT_54670 [Trichoplax adhaerens]